MRLQIWSVVIALVVSGPARAQGPQSAAPGSLGMVQGQNQDQPMHSKRPRARPGTDHGLQATTSATVGMICRPTIAMGNFVPTIRRNWRWLIVW